MGPVGGGWTTTTLMATDENGRLVAKVGASTDGDKHWNGAFAVQA